MPSIAVTAQAETPADTRVVGVFEGETPGDQAVADLVASGEAKAGPKKLAVTHDGGQRVIAVGLGKQDDFDVEKARVAAAVVAQRAREIGIEVAVVGAPARRRHRRRDRRGDADGALPLRRVQVQEGRRRAGGIESLEVVGGTDLEAARVRAEAANAARDLQNTPANVATPIWLAERAKAIADAHDSLTFEALDRDAIVAAGMGSFAAVAEGSHAEPRLIVLRYDGGGSGPHLGFVGKAVTFDTGGISIKPAAKMHEMKFDMSGGAAVIESMDAIATLGLPVKITAVVPATENMPGGHAMRPGDIVTASNGKTIEINNTDAEGRLILADALVYAVRQGAERIVDLATLTGAIVVALGSTYSGLFSNDDDWFGEVQAAGDTSGEIGWRLPLHPEYLELTKGQYADLTNASEVRKAGSIYAAEFLRQFVDDTPWVHVDIAGSAWGNGRAYVGNGASGYGTRMLIELATRMGA